MRRIRGEGAIAIKEAWSVSYTLSERETGYDRRSVQLSWENCTIDRIAENLNAFLVAACVPLQVVSAE